MTLSLNSRRLSSGHKSVNPSRAKLADTPTDPTCNKMHDNHQEVHRSHGDYTPRPTANQREALQTQTRPYELLKNADGWHPTLTLLDGPKRGETMEVLSRSPCLSKSRSDLSLFLEWGMTLADTLQIKHPSSVSEARTKGKQLCFTLLLLHSFSASLAPSCLSDLCFCALHPLFC